MMLAVVQHRLLGSPAHDRASLGRTVNSALARCDLAVVPFIPTLPLSEVHDELGIGHNGAPIIALDAGTGFTGASRVVATVLGRTAVLSRDACLDRSRWDALRSQGTDTLILSPGAENELQAEAVAEVALALSESVAGLVIVTECSGAGPGEVGHGGTMVVHLGEVIAEARDDTDYLTADIALPVAQPEPREPLPALPTILAQRVAHHAGHKLLVDYPADLSGGMPMC